MKQEKARWKAAEETLVRELKSGQDRLRLLVTIVKRKIVSLHRFKNTREEGQDPHVMTGTRQSSFKPEFLYMTRCSSYESARTSCLRA